VHRDGGEKQLIFGNSDRPDSTGRLGWVQNESTEECFVSKKEGSLSCDWDERKGKKSEKTLSPRKFKEVQIYGGKKRRIKQKT